MVAGAAAADRISERVLANEAAADLALDLLDLTVLPATAAADAVALDIASRMANARVTKTDIK